MDLDKKTQKKLNRISKFLGIPEDQIGSLTELAYKIANSQPELDLPFVPDPEDGGADYAEN